MKEIIAFIMKILTFSFKIPLSFGDNNYIEISLVGLLLVIFIIYVISIFLNRTFD